VENLLNHANTCLSTKHPWMSPLSISIKIYQSKVVVVKQLVALEFQWTDQSFEAFWSILKLWWSFYIAILPTRSRPVGASPRRYVGCLKRDLHFVIWNMAKS
jgi:hypothetical protein